MPILLVRAVLFDHSIMTSGAFHLKDNIFAVFLAQYSAPRHNVCDIAGAPDVVSHHTTAGIAVLSK